MERLTERFSNGQAAVAGCGNSCKFNYKYCKDNFAENCPTLTEIYEKLASYEELDEQGLLLRLPVPEGAVVYTLSYIYECKFDYDCKEFDAYKCEEDIHCEHQYKVYRVKETKFQKQMLAMLGKTVFLTKEEAEQALERMEKSHE